MKPDVAFVHFFVVFVCFLFSPQWSEMSCLPGVLVCFELIWGASEPLTNPCQFSQHPLPISQPLSVSSAIWQTKTQCPLRGNFIQIMHFCVSPAPNICRHACQTLFIFSILLYLYWIFILKPYRIFSVNITEALRIWEKKISGQVGKHRTAVNKVSVRIRQNLLI